MTADGYLRRVEWSLRDLPWSTRRKLVAELRDHLAEVPSLAELGAPEQYAADMRAAAGLERRRGAIAFLRARRPRNVVLIVVALMLIGLAIGAVEWVNSYQPLLAAGTMANPAGVRQDISGTSEWVVFHQGRPFRFGIDIRNSGAHTVRVLGIPYGPGYPFRAQLLVSPPSHGGTVLPLTRFHPFDLPPGQIRLFIPAGHLPLPLPARDEQGDDCHGPGRLSRPLQLPLAHDDGTSPPPGAAADRLPEGKLLYAVAGR